MINSGYPQGRIPVPQLDPERLHGKAIRLYLERELMELETQIDRLNQRLAPRARLLNEGWEELLELKYLEAMERAILETLERL